MNKPVATSARETHNTIAEPLLGDGGFVPKATPSTPDLVCWIWAAFPPRQDRINITRVAEALGVSRRTLSRWLNDAAGREFDPRTQSELSRRAILRGRGSYLWPGLDASSRFRVRSMARNAYTAYRSIQEDVVPLSWRTNGTLQEHVVLHLYYPHAHVYSVAVIGNDKSRKKYEKAAEVIQVRHAPNRYAGLLLKHALLSNKSEHRCIAPKSLVTMGRTETWREGGGPGQLRATSARLLSQLDSDDWP